MPLGPVLIGLSAYNIEPDERDMLLHPLVGGVVLFTRNYESIEQLENLVAAIHALREPPLLIAVDHEGGKVQRFRQGFTELPAIGLLGKCYVEKPELALQLSELSGWLMAAEVRAVGIDFSFAPVLDIDKGISQIIGDRAFSSNVNSVIALARHYIKGMHRAGMAATGKHFPGHGGVVADSHLALPVDSRSYAELQLEDLSVFKNLANDNMDAMMIAHVLYEKVDPQLAGFSRFWLRDILRSALGFKGLIFSDDLEMEGARIAGTLPQRADLALSAGCDMVLVCQTKQAMMLTLDGMKYHHGALDKSRLLAMPGKSALTREQLHKDCMWKQAVEKVLKIK